MQKKSQRRTQDSSSATNQNSLPVFACAQLPAPSAGPSPAILECSWQTNKPLWLSFAKEGCYRRGLSGKGIQQWLRIPMQQWQNPWFSPAFTGASLANKKLLSQSRLCCFKQTRMAVCVRNWEGKGRLFWCVCKGERWCGMAAKTDGRLLSCAQFRAGKQHSRPLTEHVLWECQSAGMHSASGQIPVHI